MLIVVRTPKTGEACNVLSRALQLYEICPPRAVSPCRPDLAPTLLRHLPTGHVSENVLLSGFEAGLGIRQRVDAVEQAVASSTLLADKSHWGIIRVQGEDRLRFLHSQGTNAFEGAAKGENAFPEMYCTVQGTVLYCCGFGPSIMAFLLFECAVGREPRPRCVFVSPRLQTHTRIANCGRDNACIHTGHLHEYRR